MQVSLRRGFLSSLPIKSSNWRPAAKSAINHVDLTINPLCRILIVSLHMFQHYCAAFSAAILASILLRAARIISSLRLCNEACLSSRFELHALPVLSSSATATIPILFLRLYRVIRSGCAGFSGCRGAVIALALLLPGGGGG